MSETHWKSMTDNTYLGVCDFAPGEYKTLRISNVKKEKIPPKNTEHPVIYFANFKKPLVCNATNGKTIQRLLKTPMIENWIGHEITLFADMTVRSPGQRKEDVPDGGVRVFNQLPKKKQQPVCSKCGKNVEPVTIDGKTYTVENILKYSSGMCYKCYAEKAKKEME